jgi:hypothetical protein
VRNASGARAVRVRAGSPSTQIGSDTIAPSHVSSRWGLFQSGNLATEIELGRHASLYEDRHKHVSLGCAMRQLS